MKHLHFSILLAVLMSMAGSKAWAYDAEIDGICYNFSGDEAKVTYASQNNPSEKTSSEKENEQFYRGIIVIPEAVEYGGNVYSVTTIEAFAFYGCSGLTEITIPNSVTSIGAFAFYGCSCFSVEDGLMYADTYLVGPTDMKLSSCVIKEGTRIIGGFWGCTNLTSVTIPNTVIIIQDGAFGDCSSLTEITIPNSVTNIGLNAFYNCSGLTEITIPNSVTSIGNLAFQRCSSLTSVTIPNSVTSIGSGAFSGCTSLTSVHITDLESWFNINFLGWQSDPLYSAPKIYLNGEEVKDLVIPNSVTSIGDYAFFGSSNLTSITIPNSVTSIGVNAFYNCSGLTEITIPNSVTNIGYGAFSGCSGLTSVKVEEGNSVYDSRDNCNAIIETAKNETVLCGSFSSLPSSVTSIGENSVVTSPVTIPWSVNSISSDAPYSISSEFIMNLNLNEISDWIGKDRVSDSRVSTSFTDENGNDVSDLVIPEGTTTIGSYVFKGVSSLETVTIPNSVTNIGNAVFADCNNIVAVKTYIEDLFGIPSDCFTNSVKQNATLYVPKEMRMFYKLFDGWKEFKNIVAMENSIEPVDINDDIDYGTDSNFDSNTNLNGNVVGNIFYNISDDAGEYSSTEGCIVIKKPTPDDDVENVAGLDINNEQLKDTFTGIIFMVQPGSGTITVNAESEGGLTLKVKVGDNPPTEIELDGKIKEKFPYSVDKASYVYIYAGGGSAGAKAAGTTRASSEDVLKIYGIEWTSGTDGIGVINTGQLTIDNSPVYNLNGQRVEKPAKGVFIRNGKKVLVK